MTFFLQNMGWMGTILILLAYFLVSTNRVRGISIPYQTINLIGAFFLAIGTYKDHSWPAFTLNITWGVIAIFSLIKHR